MRRTIAIALIGLAVSGASSIAGAQGKGQARAGRARAGAGDTTRALKADSLRARRDSIFATLPDSVRAKRAAAGRGGRGAARLARERADLAGLKLTDAQKQSVKAINERYTQRLKDLRGTSNGQVAGTPQQRAKVEELRKQQETEIRNLLTDEQRTRFDANAKARVGRGRGGRGTNPRKPV